MATINGARAIGMEKEIGTLETGKKADVIVINMRRPEWYPNYSEVQNLVYSASGDAVETVYIDGRLIMENRKVLTVDEDEILDRCAVLGADILKRGGLKVPGKWPIL
jgi:5-methylthioadenosine/S-adenosylhomocysteine deaminase